ncbi:TonB family protein [Ramlibacter sp. PS4R-6]|uniref:TonB family protein n=1 Tax=Ramlibacter sp. PS4R-6 TaxID=3133438 RepID=UPI003095EDB3
MQKLGNRGAAHKARLAGVVAGLLLATAHTASAQTSAPPAGNPVDNAPSEAARRAALSPYRFILQNASAPRKAAAPAPAPAPAVAEPKRAPAPAPVQQAAAQPQAPRPAPAPEVAAPPPPAPEPTVAAVSRQAAEPPPPRREIIPIQTDEPRLSPALLREQPKGVVKVHFDIQPNGTVSDVKILASTNRSLNRPTLEAIQGWKFQPVDEILTVETELVYKFD